MADRDEEDWLGMSAVDRLRRAREGLTPAGSPDGTEDPKPGSEPEPVNLAAPEHRDKLLALFQWAAEGRSWEDVRDEAVPMFFPARKPAPPTDDRSQDPAAPGDRAER